MNETGMLTWCSASLSASSGLGEVSHSCAAAPAARTRKYTGDMGPPPPMITGICISHTLEYKYISTDLRDHFRSM